MRPVSPGVRPATATAGLAAFIAFGFVPVIVPAAEGVVLRTLPGIYQDAREIALKAPEAVASDGASLVAVADTGNGRILLYGFEGGQATPRQEIRLPQITYPTGIQFTPGGDLLVLDGRTRRLIRLTAAGEFQGFVEPRGGTLVPKSFKVGPGGSIFVLDLASSRVLVLEPDGSLARSIALPDDARSPSDLAVDHGGVVYVLETVTRRIDAARPEEGACSPLGSPFRDDAAFPTGLAVDAHGLLAISDQAGHGIVFLGPDGSFRGRQSSMGWKEGQLRYPSGLSAAPPGYLLVADRGNNRVQVFRIEE